MREKIKNVLKIELSEASLSGATNMEFYIRKGTKFFQYVPEVLDEKTILVVIPKEDAMRLATGYAQVQLAYTDENGTSMATDVAALEVKKLLKEDGYGD